MIHGVVTNELEAWIDLAILGEDRSAISFSAVIDTGFSGYLTLPLSVIRRFGGVPMGTARTYLADGSETVCEVFELTVHWDDQPITIEVDAAEIEPLVGMSLLKGHDVVMRVIPNGEVTIRAVPIGT